MRLVISPPGPSAAHHDGAGMSGQSSAVEHMGVPNGKPARRGMPKVDFGTPVGAPALYAPDSMAWQVFKNPVSLFIGGVAAVLLEWGEERVRTGVWEHSIFPTDPITRMRRTGLMAQVSVYAPTAVAERLIGAVVRMHDKV